jgi:hypothetical protein
MKLQELSLINQKKRKRKFQWIKEVQHGEVGSHLEMNLHRADLIKKKDYTAGKNFQMNIQKL